MKTITNLNDGDLMLASEVANLLDVESVTIRDWANKGKLKHVRTDKGVRIFLRSDVEALRNKRANLPQ